MFSYPDKTQHIFFRWELAANGKWSANYYYDEKPTKLYGADTPHTDWVDIPMHPPFVFPDKLMIDDEAVTSTWAPPTATMPKTAIVSQQVSVSEIADWTQKFEKAIEAVRELNRFVEEHFPELKESNHGK